MRGKSGVGGTNPPRKGGSSQTGERYQAAKELAVSVRELRNAIRELTTLLKAGTLAKSMESPKPDLPVRSTPLPSSKAVAEAPSATDEPAPSPRRRRQTPTSPKGQKQKDREDQEVHLWGSEAWGTKKK